MEGGIDGLHTAAWQAQLCRFTDRHWLCHDGLYAQAARCSISSHSSTHCTKRTVSVELCMPWAGRRPMTCHGHTAQSTWHKAHDAFRHSALACIQRGMTGLWCDSAELRALSPCPSSYHCLCKNRNHNLAWGPCALPAASLIRGLMQPAACRWLSVAVRTHFKIKRTVPRNSCACLGKSGTLSSPTTLSDMKKVH